MSVLAKLDARVVDAVGVCCVLAVCGAGYWSVVRPLVSEQVEVAEREDEVRRLERTARDRERALRDARDRLSDLEERYDQLAVSLEPESGLNRRVDALARLASEHGLRVEQLDPGRGERLRRFTRVPITIGGTSGYTEMASFLSSLRERFRDVGVHELSLNGDGEGRGGTGAFRFRLEWFAASEGDAADTRGLAGVDQGSE